MLISKMSDDNQVVPPASTTGTDTQGVETPPEGQNTQATEVKEAPSQIPYDRFKEVNDKYKSVAEENLRMKEELLKARLGNDTPPEDASQEEVIEWAKARAKQELEMEKFNSEKEEVKYRSQIESELSALQAEGKQFNQDELIQFAQDKKISSLTTAYELMESVKKLEAFADKSKKEERGKEASPSSPNGDYNGKIDPDQLKKETMDQTIARVKRELSKK